MGCTINTSFCSRVTFSRRSPVAMSNGCAPVLASYSAITLFISFMSAVAGSYSRSVVSPRDENVRILALIIGLLWDVRFRSSVEQLSAGFESLYGISHRFRELSRWHSAVGIPQCHEDRVVLGFAACVYRHLWRTDLFDKPASTGNRIAFGAGSQHPKCHPPRPRAELPDDRCRHWRR